MTRQVADSIKVAADVGTGVTIAEATNTDGLLVTLFTIVGRLLLEWFVNRKTRKNGKRNDDGTKPNI